MVYNTVVYETKTNANFYSGNWNIEYIIFQSRTTDSGATESRSLKFTKISDSNFDTTYNQLLEEVYTELAIVRFDLFELKDKAYLSLKERLENVQTSDNQIAEN